VKSKHTHYRGPSAAYGIAAYSFQPDDDDDDALSSRRIELNNKYSIIYYIKSASMQQRQSGLYTIKQ